jgi:TRAP-type C4-dicarboxylate transport system permease small subunit
MISRAFEVFDRVLNWTLATIMAVMLVVISAQVFYRFVINDPLDWSEEFGRYLFVWISFLGSAAGVRYRVHLGINLIEKFVSPTVYKGVVIVVHALILAFLYVIVTEGFNVVKVVSFQESASMHIPMSWPYLAVPVGCILMAINAIRVTVEQVWGKGALPDEEND